MAPRVTCECGTCEKCKKRIYMRKYYRREGVAEKTRAMVIRYREANIEVVREKDRARGFRETDIQKIHARNATRKLRATPHACEICGTTPADAHHDNYDAPLDVRWLCEKCHGIEHRKIP